MLTDEEKRILLQNRLFAELPAERLDGLLQSFPPARPALEKTA